MKMIKRVFCLFLALTLCVGFFPAPALAEGDAKSTGTAELKSDNLQVEATSSLGKAFQNTMEEQTDPEENAPYRINGVAVEDGQVTINYVSAEDAEILVALYEDRTDALKLITTVTVEVSAEANTATATLPEEVPEYFIVGAYLIRSGSHEPLCEEYTSSYYTQAMQEFMSAPLTDFAEEAEDRMVILDQGTEEDGSDADFLIFREGTVILRETEEQNHIAKNEDGSYTITGADASALALQGGDKIGYKKLDASLDVFLVESVISQSGDTVVFTESLEIDMETFFDTIRIEEAPPSDAVEYDTSDIAPGFTYRGEGDLSEEVAPFYEAAEHLEDGEALPESLGDVVVMGGPPGTVPAEIEGSIGLDIDVDYEDVRKWIGHPLPDNGDQEEGTFSAQPDFKAEGSFSVGLKLEMQIFLTKEYQYISVNISLSQILMLKLQGGAKVSFLIGKFVVPTPISGLTFAGEVRLIFNFKVELSFVASWTSTLGFEYDSFRVYAPFRNTSSSSDTKPKTALSLKGTLEFGVKVSLKTEFISENVGKLELWGKDVITLKAETELSILRRLNQGIDSWKDLLFDGYTELDPSNSSVSEIHACDNCIAGTATKSYSVGLDLTMIKIIQGSAHADLVSCPPSDFYYSVDSREFGWTRCPHRLYKLSLTLVDGLDYTLGDVVLNWYDQDSVEAENAARHAIEGAVVTVVSKDGNYVQDRELITGKDGKVWIFLPAGNYTVRAYSDTYFGVQDFKIYDSAREYCMILEEMQGESHTEGNITWTFYPNGVLCISGTGDIADYDTGNAPWTKHRDEVNTVLIQNGITGIGDHSFSEFENVKQVQLPGSLERIGLSAFDGCSALKVITIPSGVTQIENKAFFHCGALKKAYYNGSQGQWEKGVTIGSKNEDLTDHLIFNSAVLANGQCGDALFWSLSTGGALTISGTGPMTSYASAADVPWNKYRDKIDTLLIEQGVTTLSPYAFSACAILEVAIPNSVTSLGVSCFAECPRLIRVTLPESISQIPERCFHACTEMKRINIPGHVTSIGQSAFFSCNSLKEANYMGTRWEWDKNVSVAIENGPLLQALKTLDEDMKSIGKCGDDMEAFISEGGGMKHLIIQGSGEMTSRPWADQAAGIAVVHFSGNIETLVSSAFADTALQSITIPDSVRAIGNFAFYNCKDLQTVDLPAGLQSIGEGAFSGCSSLQISSLPEGLESIGSRAFMNCTSITSLTVPNSVVSMGDLIFRYCNNLKNLTLPFLGNTRNDTFACGFSRFFADNSDYTCSALETVTVTDAYNIQEKAFKYEANAYAARFPNLRSIRISGPATSVGKEAFYGLGALETCVLPDTVTSIGNSAFYNCAKVSLTLPAGLESIGDSAFYGCAALDAPMPAGLKSIGYSAFSGCRSLQISSLPEGLESIGSRAFTDCTSITSLTVPNSVVSMGDLIFRYCNNLKNLTLPFLGNTRNDTFACGFSRFFADNSDYTCSALETVTVTDAYNIQEKAFKYEANAYAARFPNLRSIRISGPATSVGKEAFYGLGALETCVLPDTVTSIGNSAFYNCAKVSLTLPAGLESIGDSAFYGCSALDAEIPAGVKTIGYDAFHGCTSLQISSLPEGLESIGSRAFMNCTSITSLTVPNSVVSMGDLIFRYCNNLKNLTLPFLGNTRNDTFACGFSRFFADNSDYTCSALETVTVTDAYNIQEKAFKYEANAYAARFPNLRSIRISGPATSVGKEAFYGLGALETCTLPGSVSSIGNSAFYKCSKLAELSFDGTMEEWQAIAIGSGNTPLYGIPIHCSDGDLIMDPAAALEAPEEPEDAEAPLEKGEAEGGSIGLLEPTEEADPVIEPAPTEDPDPVIEPAPTEEPDPVIEPAPTKEPGNVGLASFSGEETGEAGAETIYTASFGGLMPGEEYLILAVRSDEESVLLENDNILFVGQQEANEDGALSIHYIKKSDEPALLRCYGMSDKCFTASDKLDVVISQGATDSQAFALAVSYDGVELEEARDYLVSFDYLEDDVVQITLKGIVDYSGSTVIQAKASCTGEDNIDGYAVIHMAHQWGEPVWTWSEDWTHAEAAFSCTRDEAHTITRECEVSMTTENNVTTWTAAVSLGGKQYTETHKIWHGDLNRDEKVDALDLMMMRNLLLELNQEGLDRADVNGDGTVSILDLVRLRKHLAGEEVILH